MNSADAAAVEVDAELSEPTSTSCRTCTKCGQDLPLTEFIPRKVGASGYHSWCRSCMRAANRAWREANRERVLAQKRAAYDPEKQRPLNQAYREEHGDELRAKDRERYQRDREKILADRKARYTGDYHRAYYERNRDRILARIKAWQQANPDQWRRIKASVEARRRAAKRAVYTEKVDYAAVIARDRQRCHICRKRVKLEDLTLDHLIPITEGGPHTEANLAVAHRSCNSKRGNRKRVPAQLRIC